MMRILLLLFALALPRLLFAADSALTALPDVPAPADTDILYIVTDPSGTPTDGKVEVQNLRVPEAQTLDNVFDLGKEIDGANSSTNAVKAGDGTQKLYIYVDPTTGLKVQCFVVTLNNCDYGPTLNADKFFHIKDRNDAAMVRWKETTNGTTMEWRERSNDDTTPPTGYWAPYFKSTGMYIVDDAGAVTGPLGPKVDVIRFGADDPAANDTDYLNHGGSFVSAPTSSTNAVGRAYVGFTGTVVEMLCEIAVAPTSTNTVIFALATASGGLGTLSAGSMTCTITSTATSCSTTANQAAVAKGSVVGIRKVDSASAVPSDQTMCFLRIEG